MSAQTQRATAVFSACYLFNLGLSEQLTGSENRLSEAET